MGGLGRTGTIASCVLIDLGAEPADAIKRVRKARKGTVENSTQMNWIKEKYGKPRAATEKLSTDSVTAGVTAASADRADAKSSAHASSTAENAAKADKLVNSADAAPTTSAAIGVVAAPVAAATGSASA